MNSGGVVGLEIRGLVAKQGRRRRLWLLVEAVAAEEGDQVENLPRRRLGHAALLCPLEELGPPLVDDLLLLLADRLDAGVGAGQLDAAQAVEDAHDLFLKDHDAVGLAQDFLHDRVRVGRLLAAVLAVDVGVHHAAAERAGAVQGRAGDDVADVVRLHALEQLADAVGFELEHALGVAALQQGEGRRVVERQLVQVDAVRRASSRSA